MTAGGDPVPKAGPESGLTLRALRVFVALEETGSVAAAARSLGLAKSNVSQQVTALEAAVGARLFDRDRQPAALTPAGQVLGGHAYRILAQVSAAGASLAEMRLGGLPLLNVAIIDDLDASITPALAAAMQSRMPRCFVRTFSGRSDEVNARLLSRAADVAVTASVPDEAHRLEVQRLARETFLLVAARGRYVPGRDWRAQLSRMPMVHYSEAMPMGRLVAAQLGRVGLHVERRFSFEATRSVIATVAATGGWTVSTPLCLLDAIRFRARIDVFALPFPGPSREIVMASRTGELGTLPRTLARHVRAHMREELLAGFSEVAAHLPQALEVFEEPAG